MRVQWHDAGRRQRQRHLGRGSQPAQPGGRDLHGRRPGLGRSRLTRRSSCTPGCSAPRRRQHDGHRSGDRVSAAPARSTSAFSGLTAGTKYLDRSPTAALPVCRIQRSSGSTPRKQQLSKRQLNAPESNLRGVFFVACRTARGGSCGRVRMSRLRRSAGNRIDTALWWTEHEDRRVGRRGSRARLSPALNANSVTGHQRHRVHHAGLGAAEPAVRPGHRFAADDL